MSDPTPARADYGLDAPGVVRNLFIGGAVGLLLWGSAAVGLWSGHLLVPVGQGIQIGLAGAGLGAGIALPFTACWMIWESRVGKLKGRERLLQRVPWRGDEQVLDLGCGRGLLLIGAARRLKSGKATGVDIWQSEDLSDNRPDATLENARREGVEERVEIRTADMRELPFPDNTFDGWSPAPRSTTSTPPATGPRPSGKSPES